MVPSSSGLGHHPLKVEARVRIPLGLPEIGDSRRLAAPTKVGVITKGGVIILSRARHTGRSGSVRLETAARRQMVRCSPARLARVGAANGDVTPVGGASGVPSPGARVPTRGPRAPHVDVRRTKPRRPTRDGGSRLRRVSSERRARHRPTSGSPARSGWRSGTGNLLTASRGPLRDQVDQTGRQGSAQVRNLGGVGGVGEGVRG